MDLLIAFLMSLGPSVLMTCALLQWHLSKLFSGTLLMLPRDWSSQEWWVEPTQQLYSLASLLMKRAGAILVVRMVRSKFGLMLARQSNASKLTEVASLVLRLQTASLFQEVKTSAFALCLLLEATSSSRNSSISRHHSPDQLISWTETFSSDFVMDLSLSSKMWWLAIALMRPASWNLTLKVKFGV